MAPRKKLTSKRVSTRQRCKIDKKVREHKRKLRKTDAKNVHKSRKDPGIPAMWPLKESLINKLRADQEKEQTQKALLSQKSSSILALVNEASSKNEKFLSESERIVETKRSAALDNSKKAFFKEFRQVVDKADVILQVLDARDPLGCRVKELEEMILKGGAGKRIVLVLNKIDLVPKEALEGWLKYLRREFPTVAFKASTQTQRTHLGHAASETVGSGSDCLGADTLVQLLKNYCRSKDIKTAITVGVVGYPNVGKSSLINSLKRTKVCRVGATPGVTTSRQEIHLDRNIKLLDCPGIVFAYSNDNDDLFLRNCLKLEQLSDPITPVYKIVERAPIDQLMRLYQIPSYRDASEFLLHVARRTGKLRKGGLPNIEAAAKVVLHDWNQGKIPYYMSPPSIISKTTESAIVSSWAPEFDLSGIEKMEIESVLPNIIHYNPEDCLMEPEVEESSKMQISSIDLKSKDQDKDSGYDIQLSVEETRLNPQLNKQRQKALKKAKKAASKLDKDDINAMEIDDSYDFSALQ